MPLLTISRLVMVTIIGLVLPIARSQTRSPIDVSKLGPQIGERVPEFNLKDQTGKTWTLQSILGPKGALLVFFRSADW